MQIIVLTIVILIMSAVFHEYAHGWVAYKLGDNTAKSMGRLTLNPINHLDPVGSILLPILLILSGSNFVIGWAKPVPYNPYNLRDARYGDMKVALGGPGTNLILAIFFGFIARLTPMAVNMKYALVNGFLSGDNDFLMGMMSGNFMAIIFVISVIACFINLLLMIFNLVPVPPLDGSKVLMTFLPHYLQVKMHKIEPYGFFILIFLLWLGIFSILMPAIIFMFSLFTGLS